MTLRFAKEGDLSALQELYGRLLKHHQQFGEFHSYTEEMVRQRAALYSSIIASGEGFILVEDIGGAPVAMMVSQYLPSDPGMPEQRPVLLQDGYVMPEHQKKGIYRKMLEKSIELCKKDGRGSLLSWVATENRAVWNLLEKDYGFKGVLMFEYKKL